MRLYGMKAVEGDLVYAPLDDENSKSPTSVSEFVASEAEQCRAGGPSRLQQALETKAAATAEIPNAAESQFRALCVCKEKEKPVREPYFEKRTRKSVTTQQQSRTQSQTQSQRQPPQSNPRAHSHCAQRYTHRNDRSRLHVVTAEEVQASAYCIHDVILPLPGVCVCACVLACVRACVRDQCNNAKF